RKQTMSTDGLLWYLTYQVGAEQAEHLLDVSQLVVWGGVGGFRDMGGGVGQGVAPVAVVGVGPLGTGVVLALLEGNHSCPGGILVGHGVEEDEDDLVSMGVVWVVVQWGAFLV
ncbi:hypothetical protein NQZ68_039528, partial [Dissostichus eleginoides]